RTGRSRSTAGTASWTSIRSPVCTVTRRSWRLEKARMKCSAWSSLGISVCSALLFAGAASAHLSIDPQRVAPGAEVDLVFSVPNEDDAVGVDHVTLGVPADFELDDAEAK